MRVLDIDLDFFLDDVARQNTEEEERLSSDWSPWDAGLVVAFLEGQCGLKREERVRGRVVKHHVEAFHYWRELIDQRLLEVPFEVVHVDAHADLGMGDGSWAYLVSDVVRRKPEERTAGLREGQRDGLGSGNFLAFAVACRWISQLTYVYHQSRVLYPEGPNDLFPYHFKGLDRASKFLQLHRTENPDLLQDDTTYEANVKKGLIELEPEVPFEAVSPDDFHDNGNFDFVVLCRSPGFTPVESDSLIPVISEYIREDEPS